MAPTIALELFTVRDAVARDLEGTLHRVAEMGYPAVEAAGYGAVPLETMKAVLNGTGLQLAATHSRLDSLESHFEEEVRFATELRARYLVVPWIPEEERADRRRLVERLRRVGERLREGGLRLGYHNHDFELRDGPDGRLLDYLLAEIDTELMVFELDVYWVAETGLDPVRYLREYAARMPLVHFKDRAADGAMTEVGDGTLDMQTMYSIAADAGAEFVITENDRPRGDPLESAHRSLRAMQRLQRAHT